MYIQRPVAAIFPLSVTDGAEETLCNEMFHSITIQSITYSSVILQSCN